MITFLLLFVMMESTLAQVNLNFSAGINDANLKYKNLENAAYTNGSGYFIGIAPSYKFCEKVSFLVDFQYSNQNYYTGDINSITASGFKTSFINIMPEMEYQVHKKIALGVGVNYGLKLNEQTRIANGDWSKTRGFEQTKSTDFGLTGKLKVSHKKLFAFLRYNVGLKNITNLTFTNNNGQVIEDVQQLNRNLQVGIGYALSFKKT